MIVSHSHNSVDEIKYFINCLEHVVKDIIGGCSSGNINNPSGHCTSGTNLSDSQSVLPSEL